MYSVTKDNNGNITHIDIYTCDRKVIERILKSILLPAGSKVVLTIEDSQGVRYNVV